MYVGRVENILKGSLDLIPSSSPSVKIQVMGRKVGLSCKGKTLPAKIGKKKSIVHDSLKVIESRLPFKIFSTLKKNYVMKICNFLFTGQKS